MAEIEKPKVSVCRAATELRRVERLRRGRPVSISVPPAAFGAGVVPFADPVSGRV